MAQTLARRAHVSRLKPPGVSLVLAGAEPLFLDGLAAMLELQTDLRVIGRARPDESAVECIEQAGPDLALLDVNLRQPDTFTLLRRIAAVAPMTKCILLVARLDDAAAIEAFRVGVRGILKKSAMPAVMLQCVRRVHRRGLWLNGEPARVPHGAAAIAVSRYSERHGLTPREFEVATFAANGLRAHALGRKLGISPATVKVHLGQIYRKLGVTGLFDLVVSARARGLIA